MVKFIKVAIEHVWKSFAPAIAKASSSAASSSKSLSKRPLAPALRQKWNVLQSQLHTFHSRLSSEVRVIASLCFVKRRVADYGYCSCDMNLKTPTGLFYFAGCPRDR